MAAIYLLLTAVQNLDMCRNIFLLLLPPTLRASRRGLVKLYTRHASWRRQELTEASDKLLHAAVAARQWVCVSLEHSILANKPFKVSVLILLTVQKWLRSWLYWFWVCAWKTFWNFKSVFILKRVFFLLIIYTRTEFTHPSSHLCVSSLHLISIYKMIALHAFFPPYFPSKTFLFFKAAFFKSKKQLWLEFWHSYQCLI